MIKVKSIAAISVATMLTINSSFVIFANDDNFNTDNVLTEFNTMMNSRALERKSSVKETKLIGTDRYKTAIAVSKAGWGTSKKAVLINGTALADALCASPLADEYNAPILLTEKDKINSDTLQELKRLGVSEVTLIGSTGVISQAQENELKAQGFKVERFGGTDRFDTSYKIANKLNSLYANKGGERIGFIANGVKGLADATSVASPSGSRDGVILYTNGTDLNSNIKSYIDSNLDTIYIIGSTGVVSQKVENELKQTKNVIRIGGVDRKDTNAKVINEFYPQTEVDSMYVAKDGMGNESELVDGLSVGALASQNNAPIILASDNLGQSQEEMLGRKTVIELAQVGSGRNATPYSQATAILNGIAMPESPDGMKLPTLNLAQEKSLNRGGITVKFGDTKLGAHAYGSNTQNEYNQAYNWVRGHVKTVDFRKSYEWAYLQYYLNGGRDDNYVDKYVGSGSFKGYKQNNGYIITGLEKGLITRQEAENLAIYRSVLSHVSSKLAKTTDPGDGSPRSAYDVIFNKVSDCDADAQLNMIVGDILGFNMMIAGTTTHQEEFMLSGNYWWKGGNTPTINKNQSPYKNYQLVIEAPTINIESAWTK